MGLLILCALAFIGIVIWWIYAAAAAKDEAIRLEQERRAEEARRKKELEKATEQAKKAAQAQKFYKMVIENDLRIAQESLELINTSKNVDVALHRIATLRDAASRLKDYHDKGLITVSDDVLRVAAMSTEENQSLVMQIIQRTLDSTISDANNLKTERGKNNRITNYFNKLSSLSDLIPAPIIPQVQKLARDHGISSTWPCEYSASEAPLLNSTPTAQSTVSGNNISNRQATVNSHLERYRASGCKKVRWLCKDKNPECLARDHKVYWIDNAPPCPANDHCKCRYVAVVELSGENIPVDGE